MSFFEPDLKIEVTLTIFHMSGKIPISNEELNMAASGLHKIPAASLTNFTETLSYPADLEHFQLFDFFFDSAWINRMKFETRGCRRPFIN